METLDMEWTDCSGSTVMCRGWRFGLIGYDLFEGSEPTGTASRRSTRVGLLKPNSVFIQLTYRP